MFHLCEIFLDIYSAIYNFTCVVIISKTGFFTFTPFCAKLVIVSEIKVAFSKSCPVIKINLVQNNSQDKGQCLPSSDTSEVAVLQFSNEIFCRLTKVGEKYFVKSDEFVLPCVCVQPAFSESRRAFAYACML